MLNIKKFPLGMIAANCYVVWSDESKKGVMIDPGGYSPALEAYIRDNRIAIDKILLTHGHYDHIGGLYEAIKLTGAKVYIHKDDADCLTSANANISVMFGMSASFDAADQFFKDGDVIDIADGYTLQVIHTPGHTPGGVCFYCEKAKVLFSGDTLFCASIGRTDFPGGDYHILMDSLNRLMRLDDDVKVYPGHNADTDIGYERTHNPFIARSTLI